MTRTTVGLAKMCVVQFLFSLEPTELTPLHAQRNFSLLVQCCHGAAFARVTRRSEFGSRPRIGLGARARKHLRLRQRSRPLVQLGPIRSVPTPIGALVSTPSASCFEIYETKLQRSCTDTGYASQIFNTNSASRIFIDARRDGQRMAQSIGTTTTSISAGSAARPVRPHR